jgi:hypothetical protein
MAGFDPTTAQSQLFPPISLYPNNIKYRHLVGAHFRLYSLCVMDSSRAAMASSSVQEAGAELQSNTAQVRAQARHSRETVTTERHINANNNRASGTCKPATPTSPGIGKYLNFQGTEVQRYIPLCNLAYI